MRKLFTSFTGLLHNLAAGSVSQEDLDTALFFFGCARIHALAPWEPTEHGNVVNEITWAFKKDMARGEKEHARLVDAILRAEHDGRVRWIKTETGRSMSREEESAAMIELCQTHGVNLPEEHGIISRHQFR